MSPHRNMMEMPNLHGGYFGCDEAMHGFFKSPMNIFGFDEDKAFFKQPTSNFFVNAMSGDDNMSLEPFNSFELDLPAKAHSYEHELTSHFDLSVKDDVLQKD